MTFEEVSPSSFLVPSFPILWFATHSAGSHFIFKWRCKDRQKGNAHGRKRNLSSGSVIKWKKKERKRKKSRKIGEWTLMNLCFWGLIEGKIVFPPWSSILLRKMSGKTRILYGKSGDFSGNKWNIFGYNKQDERLLVHRIVYSLIPIVLLGLIQFMFIQNRPQRTFERFIIVLKSATYRV